MFSSSGIERVPSPPVLLRAIVQLLLIAALLRTSINSVAPALPLISAQLGISATVAGLTSTLPLLCFGIFALATPWLLRRFDIELTITILLVLLSLGTALRVWPTITGLLGGTIIIGIGAAIGNAVVPVAIREFYPRRATRYMGLFSASLSIGASIAAGVSMPLIRAGLAWQFAINIWLVANVVGLVWWLIGWRSAHAGERTAPQLRGAQASSNRPIRQVIGQPRVWLTCAHMGVQSAMFFALMTWGPSWLQAAGRDASSSGLVLSVFSLASLPGAIYGARLITSRWWRPLLAGYTVVFCLAVALMCFNGLPGAPWLVWVGTLVGGVCQGALLTSSLTFITGHPDARAVPAVSALGNGIGFLIAASWPIGLGLASDRLGTLTPIIWSVALLPLAAALISAALLRGQPTRTRTS